MQMYSGANSFNRRKRGGSETTWSGGRIGGYYLMGIITLTDVGNGIGGGLDLISILVGDLDRELLLDGHDDLDSVQGVQSEISVEVGNERDLQLSERKYRG